MINFDINVNENKTEHNKNIFQIIHTEFNNWRFRRYKKLQFTDCNYKIQEVQSIIGGTKNILLNHIHFYLMMLHLDQIIL